jgi:hypothetical protein
MFSSLNARDQVSHSYKTTGKIIDFYILIFIFVKSDLKKMPEISLHLDKEIVLFVIYDLFSHAVSNPDYIALNNEMTMESEWGGMWKEAVLQSFEVLSWNLFGVTENNHENPQPE